MENHNKKWQLLAADVEHQNEDAYVKCLREFMQVSHLLGKYLDSQLGIYGLNRTQRRIVVCILYRKEPMTPTEISKIIPLTIDTINKSIDKLDKMGLTRSYHSRSDRRVRRVTLTKKGLEIIERSLPLRHQTLSQVMGCFSKGQIRTLSGFLERLLDQIRRLIEQSESES